MRFAHPFFTATPVQARTTVPGVGKEMTDYVQTKLLPIPPVKGDSTMGLSDIIGTDGTAAILQAGSMTFHAVGDTGNEFNSMQETVADAMSADYDTEHPATSPAFFLHLGDVIYYENTDKGYQSQFYIPYKNYPGKIIAIPGNHDGEIFKYDGSSTGQKKTLEAFQRNFCQSQPGIPPDAGTIYREMVSQPGVYWYLDTPFIDIVGLYSNIGEGPGFISGPDIGQIQKKWLINTLTAIKKKSAKKDAKRKILMFAVHHPPFSAGGHSSSTVMLADIDEACQQTGCYPDVVLAAHSHNYQRFTRYQTVDNKEKQIPYYVVGTGGRGLNPVSQATSIKTGDHSFDAALSGYGYLTVTASPSKVQLRFIEVDAGGKKTSFDPPFQITL